MWGEDSWVARFIEGLERKAGHGVTLVLLSLVGFMAGTLLFIFVEIIFRVLEVLW